LLAMQASGSEVLVIAADASNLDEMRQALAKTEQRFGDLHGVIHAAGNISADGFGSIGDVDRAMSERQFRPKAHGVLVLEQLLRERRLDFCMMVSSLSAVLGGLGLLPYAAANLYLDAFVACQTSAGRDAWISVNWDAWHFPEQTGHAPPRGEAVTPEAGADAFLRIVAQGPRQVVVSVTDLEERVRKWIRLETLHEPAATAGKTVTHARPNLSTEFVAPRSDTEKKIAAIWQQVLGVEPVGIHDKFFDLGGHSLLAIELISQLRDVFQVDLEPKRLFEAPTISQLAERIDGDVMAFRTVDDKRGQEWLADILTKVENLSDEEVTRLLASADHGSHA
jgi:acyl carrier protein